MIIKILEIRDRGTLTVGLAIRTQPDDEQSRRLLARAGYGVRPEEQTNYVLLAQINGGGGRIHCDPYDWGDRTWSTAHRWIREHFDELRNGSVVDVERILGESEAL